MYRRILVATDGSATAARAVDRAAEVAAAAGAPLAVLSVARDDAVATAVVDAELARLAGAGVVLEGVPVVGDPASVIIDVAERGGYDLVVVGNVGMTGDRRHFALGSVPNTVSHALGSSALLIVRTET